MANTSEDNSSNGQIIKLGTDADGSSMGDMASLGDMNMEEMASFDDDDQSGAGHPRKSQSSQKPNELIEEDSGQ